MGGATTEFGLFGGVTCSLCEFKAGEIIFKQGDVGQELFVVNKGKVELRVGDHVLDTLSSQNIFGELALIDSAPRSATAVAITDVTLVSVGYAEFMSLASEFALNVMREISRRLRYQARANELMNIDAITASIIHEIKQPLAAIGASAGAAQRFLAMDPPNIVEVRSSLKNISNSVQRSGEVLDGIRALFQGAERARMQIDLNDIVVEVLQIMTADLERYDVAVIRELTDSIPAVLGNRTQLRQVLSNIVRNAIEAMSTTFDKVRMLRIKTAPYEDGVAVSVEDSGPGIDPTMVETLFDAFVTTKSYGTGLGLAICRMIVHHHGGQLKASSNDSGALFQVVLPTISDAQPKSAD
jgi:C4-dicarboxylate-specific signal transduction histidine kinase